MLQCRHLSGLPARGRGSGPRLGSAMIYPNVLSLIGNTPLVRLNAVTRGLNASVVAKLELLNPGGSVKDRIGFRMLEEAERRGWLKPGGTIVEPTLVEFRKDLLGYAEGLYSRRNSRIDRD